MKKLILFYSGLTYHNGFGGFGSEKSSLELNQFHSGLTYHNGLLVTLREIDIAAGGYSHLAGGRRRKILPRRGRQTSHGKEGRAQFVLVDISRESGRESIVNFQKFKLFCKRAQLAYPSDTSF
jgi:hypothetical protein